MSIRPEFWRDKRVFLTGHTGFKGSWMSLWLQSMGANVHGYALPPPTNPSLFVAANVADGMASTIADVRDLDAISRAMAGFQPEIVIHMAAQPLVRLSYSEPVETYATNVMGTVHVLEAARRTASVRAIVNVTTDKCYENNEWVWGYRENEPMGGHDPYSNSKGCSELVTSAYRRSFFSADGTPALASARAGNVIGGGDWAADRLIPDILRAFERGEPVVIRNPFSIRPWQHVLEPISGYLMLAEKLYSEGHRWAEAWNFGPDEQDARPVQWIVEELIGTWGNGASWRLDGGEHPHEANYLKLDIAKARSVLGWRPRWNLATALAKITAWQQAQLRNEDVRALCIAQIAEYSAS
ncbi:CDP-glucose 4,6-dehydratase [Pandoraea apista]|uniref:CDP-glucose 4,6-dehydratase n=1 Tax=Pandoraea apista TaxID=93218 RepID=UPI000659B34C|nr:CDP-glucose 4,6-dehydratase [Pandoraea apista]ALS66396.1 CDP-glucose 4,6-dehydratase [Pandoraea apista]CFB61657.1 CDP-glucose 4,6-dehydratase [Pandoraea apista]